MAGSAVKDRVIYPLQTRVINPVVMLAHNLGFPPPGDALLETTGRPVRTPMCDGLDGEVFWLVAQRGRRAGWVRNIQANPRVRVKARSGSSSSRMRAVCAWAHRRRWAPIRSRCASTLIPTDGLQV